MSRVHLFVQSSALRTRKNLPTSPSAEALGYSRSVRFADDEAMFLRQGRVEWERFMSPVKRLIIASSRATKLAMDIEPCDRHAASLSESLRPCPACNSP